MQSQYQESLFLLHKSFFCYIQRGQLGSGGLGVRRNRITAAANNFVAAVGKGGEGCQGHAMDHHVMM
jgi:hypothetical protein